MLISNRLSNYFLFKTAIEYVKVGIFSHFSPIIMLGIALC